MYSVLSKEYLKTIFTNIPSSYEYETEMKEKSEIYHIEYLSIEKIDYHSNASVKVKVTYNAGQEGVIRKTARFIFFILENNSWKYNGRSIN